MAFGLFRRKPAPEATIGTLYGAIVAQARLPAFYARLSVHDSVDGRFEMIVLHLILVLRRLRAAPAPGETGQALFDLFCRDMDHNLREMGVSDLGVPRKMRAYGESFYGRAQAYDRALDAGELPVLVDALIRNVPGVERGAGAECLAAYVVTTNEALCQQSHDDLAGGRVNFPDPAAFAAAAAAASEVFHGKE
jgi:cytochrome b pre-mRNA-processing protein 3